MPRLAIFVGIILVLLGFNFYFLAPLEHRSVTALIPSFLGVFIAAGGVAALNPARTKAGMHVAAGFALLGALGSLFGKSGLSVPNWIPALTGQYAGDAKAPLAQFLTFLICAIFVARCFKWFVDNRRAKVATA